MDATTKRICAMLAAADPELRAAAARVLGAIRPGEKPVLEALSRVLSEGVGPAGLYALGALAESSSPEAVTYMLPALAGPEQLRTPAIEAIVGFGAKAVPRLKGAALGKDATLAKGAASALARIGGKSAQALLLRALAQADPDVCKHVCFVLGHAIEAMSDREKDCLRGQVEKLLGMKRTQKQPVAVTSGLLLLEQLRDPKAKKTLLSFARPGQAGDVRQRALHALRPIADALTEAEVKTLVGYLEDEDMGHVVLPTIEVLRPVPLPGSVAKAIVRLSHSEHASVREFAVFKMGRVASPAAARILMEDLDSPEPELSRLAIASLRRNPAAVPLILKRLKTEEAPQQLWTLARILEPHAASLTAAQRRPIAAALLAYLEEDDPRAEPLAHVLRHADPAGLDAALLKRAQGLKRQGKFAEANRLLGTLLRGGGASTEAQYLAAVVALKVSAKRLGRADRHADPCLPLLDRLLGDDSFDLLKRLKAERALEPADLFYVGFHFAEGLRERREFGGALLQHIVTKSPRSANATAARNKLRLEAFDVPAVRKAKAGRTKKP